MLELSASEIWVRLLFALVAGGLIGAERQYSEKAAGLRTMTLVCLGATLFTIFSQMFSTRMGDPARVAAAMVSGIGFLGAGVILQNRGQVIGLTTAATIWLVAALGMGIGLGEFMITGIATIASIAVLWAFPRIEGFANRNGNVGHTYDMVVSAEIDYQQLEKKFESSGLTVHQILLSKQDGHLRVKWRVIGRATEHEALMLTLIKSSQVIDFEIIT